MTNELYYGYNLDVLRRKDDMIRKQLKKRAEFTFSGDQARINEKKGGRWQERQDRLFPPQ